MLSATATALFRDAEELHAHRAVRAVTDGHCDLVRDVGVWFEYQQAQFLGVLDLLGNGERIGLDAHAAATRVGSHAKFPSGFVEHARIFPEHESFEVAAVDQGERCSMRGCCVHASPIFPPAAILRWW